MATGQISSLLGTCLWPSHRLGICQQLFLFLISEKKNIALSGFSNTAGGGWGNYGRSGGNTEGQE